MSGDGSRVDAHAQSLQTTRRGGTIDLETQSVYKFGLAVAIGACTIWTSMPIAATAVIMLVSVAIAGSALAVLAAEPQASRALRPQEFATWDGLLAAALAIVGLVLVVGAQPSGAIVAVVGAITLATLSLRTRYVTR